jgi:dihydrofolate reductase
MGKVIVIEFVSLDGVVEDHGGTVLAHPTRTDEFADAMNRIPKVVVSTSVPTLDAWSNSSLLEGELGDGVARITRKRDVVVVGSTSVAHALAAADSVDESRLLVFPTALGAGKRLFVAPVDLRLTSSEASSVAILACYQRTPSRPGAPA